mgnify:FL=1
MWMHRLCAIGAAAVILAADQASKVWVEHVFALHESVAVCPVFNLTYVRNQGAAWGMLQGAQLWLALFGVAALAYVFFAARKLCGRSLTAWIALGMLSGGIVGNLIDRVRLNYVVDFLDFHWGMAHFPCFNVADAAICVSVFFLLLLQWKRPA